MQVDEVGQGVHFERNLHGDADGSDRQELDDALYLDWAGSGFAFADGQADHLGAEEVGMLGSPLVWVDLKMLDFVPEQFANRTVADLVRDIESEHVDRLPPIFTCPE